MMGMVIGIFANNPYIIDNVVHNLRNQYPNVIQSISKGFLARRILLKDGTIIIWRYPDKERLAGFRVDRMLIDRDMDKKAYDEIVSRSLVPDGKRYFFEGEADVTILLEGYFKAAYSAALERALREASESMIKFMREWGKPLTTVVINQKNIALHTGELTINV